MYSAGTAFLQVTASFRGIERAFQEEAEKIGRQIDRTISQSIPQGVREGMARSNREAERAGERAGRAYAGAFGETMRRQLDKAIGSIREIEITADTSDVDRELADVRKDLLELRDASINLEVDSDFAMLELRRIMEKLRELQGRDAEIEIHFNMAAALAELETVEQAAGRVGRTAGDEFTDQFTREVRRRLAATRGKFAEVEIGADSSELERDIAAINTLLQEVDEKVRIGVDLNETEVLFDIELVERKLRELAHSHPSVRIRTNALAVLAEVEALTTMFRGQQEEMNRLHQQALEEDEKRGRERTRMLNEAYDTHERRERDMQRMLREAYDENESRDRDRARRLAADADALRRLQGGAFGEQQRRRLDTGRNALPDIEPRLRTRQVFDDFARMRAEMEFLRDLTIGVNIDEGTFNSEIARIIAELEAVEANEVDIDVVTNARAALAELRALVGQAGRAGGDAGDEYGGEFVRSIRERVRVAAATITDIPIGVNTTAAQLEIQNLKARLTALSGVRIGVDMNMADFLREVSMIENRLTDLEMDDIDIQTRLEAGAARAGLTLLHQQVNAVDRDDIEIDVDVNAGAAGLKMLAMNAGMTMGRLGALIAVGASLGTAIVPAAAAAAAAIGAIGFAAGAAVAGIGVLALGLFGVIKGLTALNQYEKDAAKSAKSLSQNQNQIANALDGVRSAERNLGQTREQVARSTKDAARAVVQAERAVIDAQKEAERSVRDLMRAQKEAAEAEQDRAFSMRSNALAQRQANLDIAESKAELDKILANPRATEAEREQARITYEQRLLQMDELGVAGKRMEEERARVAKEGADNVLAAQDRVIASNRAVADAQERHARAIEDQSRAQRDGQLQILEAQERIAASQRSLAQAYQNTATAGGEAMHNLKEAMDALSPAGQRFARFLFSLKDEFKSIQHAAEEGLLPGLEQAIKNLLPYLEPFRNFVRNVATAMGEGFAWATAQLKDPIWQQFFGYMGEVAGPIIRGMFEFMMNLAKGIAGVMLGLSGFNGPIGQGVLQWSRDFAEWGSTLDSNSGWQKFLQYVKDSWPEVRAFFSGLWDFTKKFVAAAAPIGEWVIGAFGQLFEWMNKLDTSTWTTIIGAIAGVAAALLVVAGVTALVAGGWTTLIIVAIGALVAGLVWLYNNVDPVRKVFDATWKAIQVGWDWLWGSVLKPGWDLLVQGLQNVGNSFSRLNRDIIQPFGNAVGLVFEFFSDAWSRLWYIIGPGVDNAMIGFRAFGAVIVWLWQNVVSPVFGFIQVAFRILYAAFQVMLGLFQIGMKILGAIFDWLWIFVIKPLVDKYLKPTFSWLGSVIRDHVLPPFRAGMEALGKAWDILVQASKVPIKFLIQTVLNDGLLAGYNKIAKFFKVTPDNVRIDLPPGFARGGAVWGEGTETSDSILARLSKNEHVWTAKEVRAAGGHTAVEELRQMVLSGWVPGFKLGGPVDMSALPAFKDGGWLDDLAGKAKRVAGSIIGGVKDFFSDPAGVLKKLFNDLIGTVPNAAVDTVKVAIGMPRKVLDLAVDKVKDLFKFDNTGNFGPGPGFPPWPSSSAAQRGDSGVWRSVVALIRSSGIPQGSFGNGYRPGDPLWHGSGRAVDWMGYNMDALASFLAARRPLELIHRTNQRDYAFTRGQNRGSFSQGLMEAHRNHIHIAMDDGGWLEPGITSIYNGTGTPEPVLTSKQWGDISTLAGAGDSGGTNYHFQFRDTTLDPGKLRALQDRESALARQGRAR